MLGARGYKTKKALKQGAIGRCAADVVVETSMFGPELKDNGEFAIVGPDAYNNRKWYATLTVSDGKVTKVS